MGGTAKDSTHYKKAACQPIEVMQRLLTEEEFVGFLKGNIIKYRLRAGHKDNGSMDLDKANQYAYWLDLVTVGEEVIDPEVHEVPKNFVYRGF